MFWTPAKIPPINLEKEPSYSHTFVPSLLIFRTYQLSHAVLLLHFLLQLFEALLHSLVERPQVICHSFPMERDPST